MLKNIRIHLLSVCACLCFLPICSSYVDAKMPDNSILRDDDQITPQSPTLTPLQTAITHGINTTVMQLLDRNEINTPDNNGLTPLMLATREQYYTIVSYLIQYGANVNITTHTNALILAIKNEDVDCVRLLLERGANPTLPDIEGNTPLALATSQGDDEVVELIEEYLQSGSIR